MKRLFAINAILFVALAAHCAPLATEGFVANKIAAAISHIPPPDFSTSNAALVETIEAIAPAPGNYAAVSNAAVHAAITNALQDTALESHASQLSQLSQALDGKVPTSRTINGKALTSNISLSADEVGAYSTNETMYVDYIGDIGLIYGDYMPEGVWDFGDGGIRIASLYQFNLHIPDGRQADGIEIFDTADPTIKTVIPVNGSDVATKADVTAAIREQSLGGIWDEELQVWWTPVMRNGSLSYQATTNVNLNAEN